MTRSPRRAGQDNELAYSPERKAAVLEKMPPPNNMPLGQLAKEEGISVATLARWRAEARAKGRLLPDANVGPEGWTSEDKLAAVIETASMNEAELGEYCRRRGIYPEQLVVWREACRSCLPLETTGGGTARGTLASPAFDRCIEEQYFRAADYFSAVVEGLGRAVFLRRVTPSQTIAIDENYAAENTTIIDAGLAMAPGEERFEALHLRLGQPVKIAHRSGLLAEPESRQMPEINGSGA